MLSSPFAKLLGANTFFCSPSNTDRQPSKRKNTWFTAAMLLISFSSLIGYLAAVAGVDFSGSQPPAGQPTPVVASASLVSDLAPAVTVPPIEPAYIKPIEQIQLGERVVADNPDQDIRPNFLVEPTVGQWGKVQLVLLQNNDDLVAIELLRPLQWISDLELVPESVVDLDLPELGARGPAMVIAIESCPQIKPGDGHVVTGRFVHLGQNLVDVTIEDNEPIGCTSTHPFWSVDQQDFVEAGSLKPGERLRTHDNRIVTLTSIVPRAGPEPVYNLEVNLEHVYHVGATGTLVHNSCVNKGGRFADIDKLRRNGEVGHHVPQNAFNRNTQLSRRNGPAVGVSIEDHKLTRTFAGRGRKSMRADNALGLGARSRLAKDIRDLRSLFGRKYNRGSLEAIEYAKTLKQFFK